MLADWRRQSAAFHSPSFRSKWRRPSLTSDQGAHILTLKTAPSFSTGRRICRSATRAITASTRWRRQDHQIAERVDLSSVEAGPRSTTRMTTIERSARSSTAMASTQNPARKHDEESWFGLRRYLLKSFQWARSTALRTRPVPFLDRCKPGVFVAESPEVVQDLVSEAKSQRLIVAWVDMDRMASYEELLAEAGRVLSFPDYYGQNWDAFEECIRDLSWLPARGYLLVLAGYDRLARGDPANWAIGLDVLEEAVSTWARTESPMYVVLQGPGDMAPGVPALWC